MALELLVILGLVLLNGLFAGAEIAIVALRGSRLRQLATAGSHRARAVQRLRENPERFLATVQIGITVIGAAAGAFGGARFGRDLEPFIRRAPYVGAWSEELSLALVVAVCRTCLWCSASSAPSRSRSAPPSATLSSWRVPSSGSRASSGPSCGS